MRNKKLLDAIEDYVMKSYDVIKLKNTVSENYKKSAGMHLAKVLTNTSLDDVVEIFDDLRDYWDTLEVGK
jgi:hypothetical protein